MHVNQSDIEKLSESIKADLGADWAQYPGGWPHQIEAALVDAVLTIRARYGKEDTGVRAAVGRWRRYRQVDRLDDLTHLAQQDPEVLANTLENHQKLNGGTLKSAAIIEAAQNFTAVGVVNAADVDPDSAEHRLAYTSVRGLGMVTWSYLTMLLGTPGIKADTWITRYVEGSLGRSANSAESRRLLLEVAARFGVDPTALDHAIWSYIRSRR